MIKKKLFAKAALFMAVTIFISSIPGITLADENASKELVNSHKKINLSEVTGEIVEPPLLSSAASSVAKEKAWYEYVYYSENPVAYYYVDDNTRVSFFDPYDYADALIMEVDDTITDWSSNNSMSVSYTTGNSLTDTKGSTSETVTSTQLGYSDMTTTITGESTVETTVKNNTNEYNTSKTVSTQVDNSKHWGLNEGFSETVNVGVGIDGIAEIGGSTTLEGGATQSWVTGEVINTTEVISTDGSGRTGYTESTDKTTVTTGPQVETIVNTIADRTTKATGYATNSAVSLSTNNSTTITKTYDAGYFNDRGAPLQWKIIKYTVKMPMFYQAEYLVDGEWIHGDSNYCTINTIQGTCRAWLENNVAYYEHWGTGEPVTWDEFWGQFFTEESLIAAYKNRLYPEN